jgi:hypothetical protein
LMRRVRLDPERLDLIIVKRPPLRWKRDGLVFRRCGCRRSTYGRMTYTCLWGRRFA